MKHIIFIQTFIFINFCFGQEMFFVLTPNGFETVEVSENDFLVINFPNKTKAGLYKESLIYFNSIYKSPKNVISTVENEIITINGFAGNSIRRNGMHVFDMDYNIVIKFKDNKVRIDKPSFKLTTFTDHQQVLHVKWKKFSVDGSNLGIYGKKDKLKSKKAKEDLELFYNSYIAKFINSLNSKEEDW